MKAITLVDQALMQFARESGMTPRVILLPIRIFRQYEREANLLESVLPRAVPYKPDDEQWTDVRVVEHEAVETIEVY